MSAAAHHAPRLLLVDPLPASRLRTAELLGRHGHAVRPSDDADDIARARQLGCALVLMNPAARAGQGLRHGHDAWQRLRDLREQDRRLPVIVMQRRPSAMDRTAALELGADAVLAQPADPRELLARVQSLLRRHQEPARAALDAGDPDAPRLTLGQWQALQALADAHAGARPAPPGVLGLFEALDAVELGAGALLQALRRPPGR